MDYAVVEDGVITNVIVIDDPKYAEAFHALPLKKRQGIGDIYEAPDEKDIEKRVTDVETSVDSILDILTQ